MVPEQVNPQPESVSGWSLRQAAESAGFPVTFRQLERYASWGILGEPADGRWPPEAVDRLIEARKVSRDVRSLPRLVLRLRANFLRFPIHASAVRRALVELAPAVANSRAKVHRMEQALSVFGGRLAQTGRGRLQARVYPTPPQTGWAKVLIDARLELVEARVAGWYAWANWVLPAYRQDGAPDLVDIPVEEQVLILAVRDLDADRRLAAWHRSQAAQVT
jgi:hypothetical protein